ncbi:hypothetical protein AOQ84DRAFT_351968 [Glonium stellatum]|uniref:Uncharacterized protein n=1 Tax=Glonium stellatum TaxID=574774 RepID=A0A8E2JXR9_9PEZI|nr:hypothetical protein AOQ84DRAFT_351968 [Glonium stellatum]
MGFAKKFGDCSRNNTTLEKIRRADHPATPHITIGNPPPPLPPPRLCFTLLNPNSTAGRVLL